MNSPAIPIPHVKIWQSRDPARYLFNGFLYATWLTALIIVALTLDGVVAQWMSGAEGSSIRHVGLLALRRHLRDIFPAPLIIVLCLNLGPRTGAHVIVRVTLASLLCALWRQLILDPQFQDPAWRQGFLIAAMEASTVAAVCAYRARAQDASQRLLRTKIDRTTLDAELKRAQMQRAHAQIEPHFLFNTLATVRALERAGEGGTVEILDRMIRYFDAALPRLRAYDAPLGQEMELIEAYLGIYQLRMGARLTYELMLAAGLAEVRVPTMMLITLVENALKHGVSPLREGGHIRVRAYKQPNSICLTVEDSGIGLSVREGSGMGLANIRQRLLLTYGASATLDLARASPHGVIARISLPLRLIP